MKNPQPGLPREPGTRPSLRSEPQAEILVVCPKCSARRILKAVVPQKGLIFVCPECRAKLRIQRKAPLKEPSLEKSPLESRLPPNRPTQKALDSQNLEPLDPDPHELDFDNFDPRSLKLEGLNLDDLDSGSFNPSLGLNVDPNIGLPNLGDPNIGLPNLGDLNLVDPSVGDPNIGLPKLGDLNGDLNMGPDSQTSPQLTDLESRLAKLATCPGCLQKVRVAKDPNDWATCPECGEKFLTKAQPAWPDLMERPQLNLRLNRSRKAASLFLKVDAVSQLYEIGVLDSAPAQDRKTIMIALLAVIIGVLIYGRFIVGEFQNAADLAEPYTPPTTLIGSSYGEKAFIADLSAFHRWSREKALINFPVTQSGPASRLFKYAMARLAPDECQEFTSLTLSTKAKASVHITGQCFDAKLSNPTALVRWRGREALVTVPDSLEVISVVIYPPDPATQANAF